jgi:protein-S-isoprenylcysteine O-methyltransferase Ste14
MVERRNWLKRDDVDLFGSHEAPMIDSDDRPDVIVWPPLLALGTLILGFALEWLAPTFVLRVMLPLGVRVLIALFFVLGGAALAVAARREFLQMGTNVAPSQPALHLVTSGVFAYVRNPMYLGLGLLVAAISFGLASDWTLVLLVPSALVLHYGVVRREESYLTGKFGEPYRRYLTAVPRYGWPV